MLLGEIDAAQPGATVSSSIDEVLANLDAVIDRALEDADPCGYFAVLYRTVTVAVQEALEAGTFDDPARMERLDTWSPKGHALLVHLDSTEPPRGACNAYWTLRQGVLVCIDDLDPGRSSSRSAPVKHASPTPGP